jgi:hypothetical protein
MSDYDGLVIEEALDLIVKVKTLLSQEKHYDMHGIAAMCLLSGMMIDQSEPPRNDTADAMAVKLCLELLATYPGAQPMLFAQLGKAMAMAYMVKKGDS